MTQLHIVSYFAKVCHLKCLFIAEESEPIDRMLLYIWYVQLFGI
jgi:hypothetical protein